MAVKNFKQYVLDHTHPACLYTFEPPEQSVLDLDFAMFEQDFSGNEHHLYTTNTYNPELARFSSGNPVFGLDHYLQSTAVLNANTGLYGKNPGLLYEFTVYGWFKPPTNTGSEHIIFGQRSGSRAPNWIIYAVNDQYIRARYSGTSYNITEHSLIQGWNSLLVRKRYSYSDDKNYLEVFLNNVLIKTISVNDYITNPDRTFKLFSQKGQTSEYGYSTPGNDMALGCVAVWSRAITDDEINNLHQASTTGIDMPDAGGGGGIQIPGNGNTTTVSGNIKENDLPVSRRVFAISQEALPIGGSNDTSQAVLGSAISDPDSGNYSIDTSPYEGAVLVVAEDNFGSEWQPDTNYQVNDVIRPVNFQGYVYYCTVAGVSNSTEPVWWIDTDNVQSVGTAKFKAKPFSRPLAHGPVNPTIIPNQ